MKKKLEARVEYLEKRSEIYAKIIRDIFLCIGGNNLAGQRLLETWVVNETPIEPNHGKVHDDAIKAKPKRGKKK